MWGAIASAAGSGMTDVGGSYLSNFVNQGSAKGMMDYQYGYAEDLRESAFQDSMYASNTAYQRGVADMTKAGLNPMLIGMGKAPQASSPSAGGGGVGLAQPAQARMSASAADFMKLDNDTKLATSQVGLNQAIGAKAVQDAVTSASSAKLTDLNAKNLQNQINANAAEAKNRETQANIANKMAIPDAILNRLNTGANTGKNIMNMLRGLPMGTGGNSKGIPGFGTLRDGTNFNLDTGEIP